MAQTEQHPLPSGLGAHTTAREAIGERRLDGKTAIVTGGYAGIGLETTRVLAAAGAVVIVPARNLEKAQQAIGGLSNVSIEPLDLALPSTIDAFAARHVERPLHLLINSDQPQLDTIGGVYCENCDIGSLKPEGDDGVRPYAIDPALAQRLWTWSERWI